MGLAWLLLPLAPPAAPLADGLPLDPPSEPGWLRIKLDESAFFLTGHLLTGESPLVR